MDTQDETNRFSDSSHGELCSSDEFVIFYRAHMDLQELISIEIENPGICDEEHKRKKEELMSTIAHYDKVVGERASRAKRWKRVK